MCGAIIVYDDDEWELYNRVIKLMWRGCETAKSPAFLMENVQVVGHIYDVFYSPSVVENTVVTVRY